MLNIDIDFNEITQNDKKYIHALIMTLKKFKYYNSYLNVMVMGKTYVINNGFDIKVFKDVNSLCKYVLLLCVVDSKDDHNNIINYYNKILSINFGKYDVEDYFGYYLDNNVNKKILR